jgi:membrane protease YdiL (CAAX protease family)
MGLGLIVASIIGVLVVNWGMLSMLTVQDVLAFIVPAIAAMAIFYRRPLHAMCLDRAPGWKAIAIVVAFYILSLPAMNWIVSFNESMSLPASMSGIEQLMRSLEDAAAETTKTLLDIHSIWELVPCVLVVGLMAGLSEEILFRGAMLRTMQDSRLGMHAVVWIVAIVFSAIHMQFYGFIPRMLLGVWLGYLLVWTRSLWVPIIAHTLNNSTVVVMSYLANKGVVAEDFGDHLGLPADGGFPWLAMASVVVSVALAVWAHQQYKPTEKQHQQI